MSYFGTAVTLISAFAALVLVANFVSWLFCLLSQRVPVHLGLVLAALAFLVFGGWLLAGQGAVTYTWGGTKTSSISVASVFLGAGLFCIWTAFKRR